MIIIFCIFFFCCTTWHKFPFFVRLTQSPGLIWAKNVSAKNKKTDQLTFLFLYIATSSLSSKLCAYGLVRFRKTSKSGLRYMFRLSQTQLEMARLPVKNISLFVATKTAGNCPEGSSKISCGVTPTNFQMLWSLMENIQWFHTHKCLNGDSHCGHWFGSPGAWNSTPQFPSASQYES